MLSVKNSFLQVQPAAPSSVRRVRSAEAAAPPPTLLSEVQRDVVERLNAVMSSGQAPEPLRPQPPKSRAAKMVAPAVAKAVSGCIALKQVQSNTSVSTMAPLDVDEMIDDGAEAQSEARVQAHGYVGYSGVKYFQHINVPKFTNLAEEFSKAALEGPPTTMMIRNIPNRYTQRELIREMESLGFAGAFDFFYAPIDMGTMGNVGYAFVNFVNHEWAERCKQQVDGYIFKKHQQKGRRKVATVSVAHLQGLQANIRHYEKSAVNSRSRSQRCGPMILSTPAAAPPQPRARR
mmetsp:Transcript_13262/g.38140  ORF Transcript_13262/g.38140 Transcript_13262/m.38140 type:complete len:290 (+) Transcript_13262:85-954(+)